MTSNSRHIAIVLLAASLFCGATVVELENETLTEAEQRGKKIFLEGVTEGDIPIVAVLSGVDVPATVLPCGSCHGPDGKGKAEGGVQPSDIRWVALTRIYQEKNKEGRRHPPYEEKDFKKAVTLGFDPGGNALNATMPRYRMSAQDMNDLLAYIKRIGTDLDEGLTPATIKIGCLLPPTQLDEALVDAAESIIRARFDQINAGGGIYQRKIEPVFYEDMGGDGALADFVRAEQPFALGCSFLPPADDALLDYLQQQKIPLCGGISENTGYGEALHPTAFFIYPGLAEQIAGLWEKLGNASAGAVVVFGQEDVAMMERIKTQFAISSRIKEIIVTANPSSKDLAEEIARLQPKSVLYVGGGDLTALLTNFHQLSFYPRVLAPGSRAGKAIFNAPIAFNKKVILAYPTWVDQITDQGYLHFRELQKAYGLTQNYQNTQIICLAATNWLIEELKRCGNELSRAKLIATIEDGREYKSGLIPNLSFTPNKKIGSTLVYYLTLDLEKRSLGLMNE